MQRCWQNVESTCTLRWNCSIRNLVHCAFIRQLGPLFYIIARVTTANLSMWHSCILGKILLNNIEERERSVNLWSVIWVNRFIHQGPVGMWARGTIFHKKGGRLSCRMPTIFSFNMIHVRLRFINAMPINRAFLSWHNVNFCHQEYRIY